MPDFQRGHYDYVLTFDNVADMKGAPDHRDEQIALLLGNAARGDGTARFYEWKDNSVAADTSGGSQNVIKTTDRATGRWLAMDTDHT